MTRPGKERKKAKMPLLDQQTTRKANFTVLQRIDRHVEDILTIVTHVTVYRLNDDHSKWSPKDVEGALFVVKRRTQPHFQFIVMNKRNAVNLIEDLQHNFEYIEKVPYLIYRTAAQEVNGIWFYDSRECEEVAKQFARILNILSKTPPKSQPPVGSSESSEFQELERGSPSVLADKLLEPASPPFTTAAFAVPNETLEQLFRNATYLSSPKSPSPASPTSPYYSSLITSPDLAHLPVPSSSPSSSELAQSPLSLSRSPEEPDHCRTAAFLEPSVSTPPPQYSAPVLSSHVPTSIQLQPSYNSAHFLRPFPPPPSPPSLAPTSTPVPELVNSVTRDGVRDALVRLVQSDDFVEMVYGEMLNAKPITRCL